jgi:hypothetical protein
MITLTLVAALVAVDSVPVRPLTAGRAAEGWVQLFDGVTPFGWSGPARVDGGTLVARAGATIVATPELPSGELVFSAESEADGARIQLGTSDLIKALPLVRGRHEYRVTLVTSGRENERTKRPASETGREFEVVLSGPARLSLVAGVGEARLVRAEYRPTGMSSIFNGRDLDGWKVFPGDKYKSRYSVTPDGWLNVRNGPGDLQTSRTYADFVFQAEVRTNDANLNSGVFFRCLPGLYQQGYEYQIQNETDPATGKPRDFGSGAIYRRIPARAIAAKDREWFTITLLARGNRFTTWVNGWMTVDWVDERPPHENPRQGKRTGPGHLSIQGHDPTTDIDFRNLRIVEIGK